eukprot:2120402-Prorocentrum_lima.AAC.1
MAFPSEQRIDIRDNPTYVLVDIGCSRSMASMDAILAFEAAMAHGVKLEWKPCKTLMSFANGQKDWLE